MGVLLLRSLQEGFAYAVLAIGVYITFRILNTPDLTVDGSFGLGMAVSVMLTVAGHPALGLLLAFLAGAGAGTVTGLLQTKIGIHPILAGILTMTGLYSVNLFVTSGKSNVSANTGETLFQAAERVFGLTANQSKTLLPLIVCLLLAAILSVYFKTRQGLAIRATGDNEDMVRSSSVNADIYKCAGLALGNACVALSGGLIGQSLSFFDAGYGSGMVVIGLASVIIGETVIGRRSVTIGLFSAILGSVVYRMFIAVALKVKLFPSYGLKLVSAVIVALALSLPAIKQWMSLRKMKRRERI
ncbi:ABC transporter permease [Cuneatibacter sp. NSJ-177]|uniref:ABC transporter permease n=1 Tax=Cuneatibacter sp. NSJ-177 TaxID=2931401 RepID=UPI001FD415B4|nr:ABC transporter permease [Cuneatibacter sp. NSJ-177]MCJ7836861.1 ABC transporter permease [Cuneatibacter sp. NSJ-177]